MSGARSSAGIGAPWTGGDGHHAAPVRQGEVLGLVARAAAAGLDRHLGQVHADDGGRGEFLGVGAARVRRPAGDGALHDRVQRQQPLLVVGHRIREPVRHHGAVVHRVVEGGPGQHQSVQVCDGHAHRYPRVRLSGLPQRAGPRGAVHVQPFPHACVQRGQHDGCAVADEAEVAQAARVQDGVHRLPVVAHPLAGPGAGGARGRGIRPGAGLRVGLRLRCRFGCRFGR